MRAMGWMCPVLALSLIFAGGLAGCSSRGAATAPVQEAAPTITSFSASPAAIDPGETTQLSWAVSGATTVAVSSCGPMAGTCATVAPATSTTYTLIVSNAAGTARATADVAVQVGVVVGPSSVVLLPGATQQFTATVTGSSNTAVTWSVDQPAGGLISATGQYLAPQSNGTYTVRATSQADPSVSATAQATVDLIGVTLAPTSATLITGASQNFTATVTGATTNSAVTWSVPASGGGTIAATGADSATYTAPAAAGDYLVQAASSEDPSKYAQLLVTVNQVTVSVVPAAVNLLAGASYQFAANVGGTTNSAVTWSVVSGGGTINSYGLYTAPANATACQVQATSQAAPAVSGQAAVTVDLVGVSISPTAVTLDQGVVQPFTAQLAGATVSSGVLWQVVGSGGGSVDADGNYTAGTTAGTDYVNVYSQEDRTKVATATVTVNPPPGFTLSLPASLTVQQGDTVTAPITVNPTYGFTGTVAFTVPPISGTGFANSCSPSASSSKTTLSVTATPTQAAGTYDQSVTGTCGNLTVSGTVPVTVTAQNPVITSVAPSAGVPGGGTAVTITGTGLGTVSGVTFGGIASDFICVVSSKEVISNSPAGTLGTVDIQVANATGVRSALNLNEQFTYMFLPAVSSMIPDFGPLSGGTMIVLNGSGFTGATGVNFGTIPASFFHVYNDNEMITASPAITGGIASVPVTVLNEAGASATSAVTTFTYYVAPIVTGVSPSSGNVAGGDQVTLTGSNFFGATAVMFGTTAAASYTVAGNTIIAVTPAESAGAVDITVTNPSYTSATSASDTFTFTN